MSNIFHKKLVKLANKENKIMVPKYLGTPNKKKVPLFDKSFDDPGIFAYYYFCYHSKECDSVQCLEATIERCSDD